MNGGEVDTPPSGTEHGGMDLEKAKSRLALAGSTITLLRATVLHLREKCKTTQCELEAKQKELTDMMNKMSSASQIGGYLQDVVCDAVIELSQHGVTSGTPASKFELRMEKKHLLEAIASDPSSIVEQFRSALRLALAFRETFEEEAKTSVDVAVAAYKRDIEELKEELQEQKAGQQRLIEQSHSTEEAQMDERERFRHEIATYKRKMQVMEREKRRITKLYEEERLRCEDLERRVSSWEDVQRDKSAAMGRIADLLDKLRDTKWKSTLQVRKLTAQFEREKKDSEKKFAEIPRLKHENQALHEEVKALKRQVASLKRHVALAQHEDLSAQLKRSQREYNNLRSQFEEQKQLYAQSQKTVSTQRNTLEVMRSELRSLSAKGAEAKATGVPAPQHGAAIKQAADTNPHVVRFFKEKLENKEKAIERLAREKREMRLEVAELKTKNQHLGHELRAARQSAESGKLVRTLSQRSGASMNRLPSASSARLRLKRAVTATTIDTEDSEDSDASSPPSPGVVPKTELLQALHPDLQALHGGTRRRPQSAAAAVSQSHSGKRGKPAFLTATAPQWASTTARPRASSQKANSRGFGRKRPQSAAALGSIPVLQRGVESRARALQQSQLQSQLDALSPRSGASPPPLSARSRSGRNQSPVMDGATLDHEPRADSVSQASPRAPSTDRVLMLISASEARDASEQPQPHITEGLSSVYGDNTKLVQEGLSQAKQRMKRMMEEADAFDTLIRRAEDVRKGKMASQ